LHVGHHYKYLYEFISTFLLSLQNKAFINLVGYLHDHLYVTWNCLRYVPLPLLDQWALICACAAQPLAMNGSFYNLIYGSSSG